MIRVLNNLFRRGRSGALTSDFKQAIDRARVWIRDNSSDEGVFHTNTNRVVYREVTGYYIPTLLHLGERDRALAWGRHLLKTLDPDGAVTGVDGLKYVFDTAQVLRGFLALRDDPELAVGVERTMSYLVSQIDDRGAFPDPYGGKIPVYIFLYCLPPMREAAASGPGAWREKTEQAVVYYSRLFDPDDFNANAHFYGYAAEALFDLGQVEAARAAAEVARPLIRRDGALRACKGVRWISSPGQVQFASIFYKLGDMRTGDRLLEWLMRAQRPSGGFFGAYGRGTHYFTDQEPAWAVKFFIDAMLLRIRQHFEKEFPQIMDRRESPDDFRLQALMKVLDGLPRGRVLEVGCGHGRFLRQLYQRWPQHEYHGIDLSSSLVAALPAEIHGQQGDMMALPYDDGCFDAVFMVESLEHAPDWRGALGEAMRVLRPGGSFAVIDKNSERLGSLRIMPWERWFAMDEVLGHLQRHAPDVSAMPLHMPGDADPVPLFVLWSGRRS